MRFYFILFYFGFSIYALWKKGYKKIWREEFWNIEKRFTALNRAKELTLSIKEA